MDGLAVALFIKLMLLESGGKRLSAIVMGHKDFILPLICSMVYGLER